MPSSIAAIAGKAQDMRAQSLSTLMATLEAVQPAAHVGGNLADSAEAALQSTEAAIRAVIIEALPAGKVLVQVAGVTIEAELPPELLRAAIANPNLLKPGNTLLLPATLSARPAPQPATQVTLTGTATGPSVAAAPPLASPFPAGTLGAAIARLAGIAFPQAEPVASGAATPAAPLVPLRGAAPVQPLPAELAAPVLQAASRQMPLAPALTQILALPEAGLAQLPQPLREAIRALQVARPTPEEVRTPEGLREAVARSGVFLEANLARQMAGGPPITPDLKALLLALRGLTADAEPRAAGPALNSRQPAEPAGLRPQATHEAGEAPRQPELARAVEGALERVKLMQLASLPDHPEMRVTDDRPQGMRLALSIPLAMNGTERPQTAVMGLVIEHLPQAVETAPYEPEREAEGDGEAFPWKVRVALDLEETGPVQAEIALRGQSVAVTLWAERQAVAARARDEIAALHEALTDAAFEVVRLDIRDGRPQAQVPRTAPILDRRT